MDLKGYQVCYDSLYVQLSSTIIGVILYSDIGTRTCSGFPGTAGHFQQDMDVS